MVARTPDPSRYSKSQVNRAGATVVAWIADDSDHQVVPDHVIDAVLIIQWWRSLHARPLANVNANLHHYIRAYRSAGRLMLGGEQISYRVQPTQRLKRFVTIIDKLRREPKMNLARMADIGGVRVVLPDRAAVATVARGLKKNWTIKGEHDYIAAPKQSGYRAHHLLVKRKERLIEVQLRTPLQDLWANGVELTSRTRGVDFKSGRGAQAVHDYNVAVAELFDHYERDVKPPTALREALPALFALAEPYVSTST